MHAKEKILIVYNGNVEKEELCLVRSMKEIFEWKLLLNFEGL